jgi:hypothetical protein
VEGELRKIEGNSVALSSVLFGMQRFERKSQAYVLALNDIEPANAQMVVRTSDGSVYMASAVKNERDRLTIEDPLAGAFTVRREEVVEISAGPGKLVALVSMKPLKIGAPRDVMGFAPASGQITLVKFPVERAIVLSAGATATWDLARQYRLLTFKAGVADGVLPTVPVRFIVLVDGKETWKSKPRTSLDEPLAAVVNIAGASELSLKVESTAGDAISVPGIWAGISLVK